MCNSGKILLCQEGLQLADEPKLAECAPSHDGPHIGQGVVSWRMRPLSAFVTQNRFRSSFLLWIPAERARTQATELQNKLMEQDQAKLMQMVADQQRSHEEQLSQLNEKIEWENQLLAEENERMLQHKLKVTRIEPGTPVAIPTLHI